MNASLQQKAESLAANKDYDLEALISIMCSEDEKEKIIPFVKKCGRSRRYATTNWGGFLKQDSLTPNYLFKYNPRIIGKLIIQQKLDAEGVTKLLLELAENGYNFLRSKKIKNIIGGMEFDMEKLKSLKF